MRRGAVALLVLAIGLFAAAPAAAEPGGKKPRFDTTATIAYDVLRQEFTGTVDSPNAKCAQRRQVTVKVMDPEFPPKRGEVGGIPGEPGNDRPATIGIDKTNVEGLYKIRGREIPLFTMFVARVKQDVRHQYICERAVTRVLTLDPIFGRG